jgi:hypothetical protein
MKQLHSHSTLIRSKSATTLRLMKARIKRGSRCRGRRGGGKGPAGARGGAEGAAGGGRGRMRLWRLYFSVADHPC